MGGSSVLTGARYDRGDAMQVVAFEWNKRNPKAATKWVQSVADPALRKLMLDLVRK
jgi:hypothetical protein